MFIENMLLVYKETNVPGANTKRNKVTDVCNHTSTTHKVIIQHNKH